MNWDDIKKNGWKLKKEGEVRILSIDGGGIRGVFPAVFLQAIEEDTHKNIYEFFDLIVGTSTGGIIAMGLALGIPAKRIAKLYIDKGNMIFQPRKKGLSRIIKTPLLNSKYDNTALTTLLKGVFENKKIKDVETMLCITSVDHKEAMPKVYKTPHNLKLHLDEDKELWKVALATSAAPIYFPAAQVFENIYNLDGGLWANNPVVIGILEALDNGFALDNIKVLSIGTGTKAYTAKDIIAKKSGILGWNTNLVDLTMSIQTRSALHNAQYLIKDKLTRIDFDINNQQYKMKLDSIDKETIRELTKKANDNFAKHYRNGSKVFDNFFA